MDYGGIKLKGLLQIMSISGLFLYIWIIGSLAFIFWRILTSPITRIHRAVINNDLETVRDCLQKGVDADVRKGQGVTPLCIATYHGHKAIAELLLEHGADLNQGLEEENGVNPLLNAAIEGHRELVEFLLARGAKIGLHFAALRGNIDIVRDYLARNAPINSMRNRGMTPLHLAALGGQREIAELLLDNGADLNFQVSDNPTPLHEAVRGNSVEVVELFANRGVDFNRIGLGNTPLQLAIKKGYKQIVELMVAKGADVNGGNSRVSFPLHTVAKTKQGQVDIAELLIANGADVNANPSKTWGTPLHFAARSGNLAVARVLIRHGSDVNSKTLSGNTPLTKASGNQEMIQLLLAHGATDYGWGD